MATLSAEPPADTRTDRGRRLLPGLVEALAVIPFVFMLRDVLRAPTMPYLDYWQILFNETHLDGSLDFANLWTPPNQQPTVLPGLLFWLNAQLFGGDNRVLGVFVLLVAAGTVLLLRALLPKAWPRWVRAAFVPFAAALLYAPYGMHNFIAAMSGTIILPADLLAVAAILFMVRGRPTPAMVAALAASFTYGQAYALWPMLVVIAFVRRSAWVWRILPIVLGVVLPLLWLAIKPSGGELGLVPNDEPAGILFTALSVLGLMFSGGSALTGALVGAVVLAVFGAALTTRRLRTDAALLPWFAIAGYTVVSALLIGFTRSDFGLDAGNQGRYAEMSALAVVVGAVFLTAAARTQVAGRVIAVLAAAALAVQALGYPMGASSRQDHERENVIAVGVRAGAADAFGHLFEPSAALVPRLQAMHHYPFNDAFTLGCGGPELGSQLDLTGLLNLNAGGAPTMDAAGAVDSVSRTGSGVQVKGWAEVSGLTPRCVVVVDGGGVVIGGGYAATLRSDIAAGIPHVSPLVGYWVVAPADRPGTRLVVIGQDGRRFVLALPAPAK